MSALARLLVGRGHSVTGSDAADTPVLADLTAGGVEVWSGSVPERMSGADLVVASSAVPETDPEIVAARAAGTRVWRRPDLLAAITASTPTIAVTGTHGKTSGASLLLFAARGAGLDPSFVIGAEPAGVGSNAGVGGDDLLVLEADEAFGTFEALQLKGLVVTNVEPDHLDHFSTVDHLQAAFERVAASVAGPVVACRDDSGSARVADAVGAITYGTDPASDWRISDQALMRDQVSFRLTGPDGGQVPVVVHRPGIHMARNAAGVVALAVELGLDREAVAAGVAEFAGVARRWEHRGEAGGAAVVDDYAHHPTEVAAVLATATATGRRVVAVFQPHLYSRTASLAEEFGRALAAAPVVVVLDVYGAREAPVAGVDGTIVSDAARRAGGGVVVDAPVRSEAAAVVAGVVRPGDLVVTMGAGDVTTLADELLPLLGDPA